MYKNLLPGEPVLMPWQSLAFNADTFIAEKFIELRDRFKIDSVIECGSAVGGTTKWLGQNFKFVYTTEINPVFRGFCLKRIEGLQNVQSFLSNTVDVLPHIINDLEESAASKPILVFCDDHWLEECPLLRELEILAECCIKEPVIAIHDFFIPNEPELGFDSIKGQPFTLGWIAPYLERIYSSGYEIEYNTFEKSAGAKRGIIYITPKP